MPPDPVRAGDTRAWLEKADMDLRSAQADLAVTPPILGDALFHCQQAAEKALKAFLTWHDRPFRKTHDLAVLGGLVADIESPLESLLRRAAPLTEYAWRYRYPGQAEPPTSDETQKAIALAEQVVAAILERIPKEARPKSNG